MSLGKEPQTLLYVWIEEYGSIKKQGFCLSSEYHIVFNESDSRLNIVKNPSYIPRFWGDDRIMEVTAIVGQNGSGKSMFLDFIKNTFPIGAGHPTTKMIFVLKQP